MTTLPFATRFRWSCRQAAIRSSVSPTAQHCWRLQRTRTPACILLDVHIPGKSGPRYSEELHGEDYPAPIFMISGQGDIAMAVSAIKNGALDFIEKAVSRQ
jgi:FixJ family two-component response regulator